MSPVLNRTSYGTKIDESKHTRFLFFLDTKTTATFWVLYMPLFRDITHVKWLRLSVVLYLFSALHIETLKIITCTILFLKVTIYVAEFQQLKQEMFLWILFWAVTVGLTLSLQDYSNNFVALHVPFNLWIKVCGLTIKMKPLFHHLIFHSTIILFLSILQKGILHSFWEINT